MCKVFFKKWLVKDQVHESNWDAREFWLLIYYLVHCSL